MADRLLADTAAPLSDKVLGSDGYLSVSWRQYFGRLPATLFAIPSILNVVSLSGQAASIGATDFQNYVLLKGTYRITYGARIFRAATVSSSLTVTFTWSPVTGTPITYVGPAIIGNTTDSYQSVPLLVRCDAGTAVQYGTAYFSAGATTMLYDLDVLIEKIKV